MKDENVLRDKSFLFATRCLRLNRELAVRNTPIDIRRQVLKSGTSIGANVKESLYAQSKADFLAKLSIAKKEAAETEYWLELLAADNVLTESESASLLNDCRELLKMLVATCKKIDDRTNNL